MSEMNEFLKDYIFSGIDDEGLTSNDEEIMRYVYGNNVLETYPKLSIAGQAYHVSKKSNTAADEGPRDWFGLRENEEGCRNRTKEEKEAAIFYAMRDSLKMSTREFAILYNPTSLPFLDAGDKCRVLHCLDQGAYTQLGNTDLDTAMLLVAANNALMSEASLYAVAKRYWNLKRGKELDYQYNNPAEQNSKIMASLMNNGVMKFHDFFPQYLHRLFDLNDPINASFAMKVFLKTYGDNLVR